MRSCSQFLEFVSFEYFQEVIKKIKIIISCEKGRGFSKSLSETEKKYCIKLLALQNLVFLSQSKFSNIQLENLHALILLMMCLTYSNFFFLNNKLFSEYRRILLHTQAKQTFDSVICRPHRHQDLAAVHCRRWCGAGARLQRGSSASRTRCATYTLPLRWRNARTIPSFKN